MRKDPDETYSLKEKLAVTAVLLLPVALAVVAMIGEKRHLREVEAMKSRPVRYYEYAIRPVDTVLNLIRTCRGVVVLAHPSVYHSMELARELIAAGRLDGVEIDHPRNTPEDKAELLRLAKEHDLIITGGTDYHGINTNTPRPVGAFSTASEQISRIADLAKARKSTLRKPQ